MNVGREKVSGAFLLEDRVESVRCLSAERQSAVCDICMSPIFSPRPDPFLPFCCGNCTTHHFLLQAIAGFFRVAGSRMPECQA